jgi:uncharacterized protein YegL
MIQNQPSDDRSLRKKPPENVTQPPTFLQLGILVLDGSGSMTEPSKNKITKGQEVSIAVKDLFSRFKASTLRNNFRFAVVCYDNTAKLEMDVTALKDIDENRSYDPTKGLEGTTSIAEGLKVAKQISDKFLTLYKDGELPRKVLVLLMTDGVDMTELETIATANTLKTNPKIQIASCFFETLNAEVADMNLAVGFLQSICSDTGLFAKVHDADSLRGFFERSMSNVAGKKLV